MIIRKASVADLLDMTNLEARCFQGPWEINDFLDAFKKYHMLVLCDGDELVGYVVFVQRGKKLEIINVAVAPERRQQGLGTELCVAVALAGPTTAFIPENNLVAQLFFRSLGFSAVQIHRQGSGNDIYEFRNKRRKRAAV